MIRVLVAIPAHNERDEIGPCLRSVLAAARAAEDTGACSQVRVGVGLNRCTDRTADVVAEIGRSHGRDIHAFDDLVSRSVGAVRARLVGRLLDLDAYEPSTTWLFNTDADTRVPVDWISRTLLQVVATDVRAVTGMVALRDWTPGSSARATYDAIVASGIDGSTHTHVYGANLAVRLDAYDRIGGFRDVPAEDHDLVDRLRLAGERVASCVSSVVDTSAREPGRAALGLGALLRQLSVREDASPS